MRRNGIAKATREDMGEEGGDLPVGVKGARTGEHRTGVDQ
jgi:hypothetical protein